MSGVHHIWWDLCGCDHCSSNHHHAHSAWIVHAGYHFTAGILGHVMYFESMQWNSCICAHHRSQLMIILIPKCYWEGVRIFSKGEKKLFNWWLWGWHSLWCCIMLDGEPSALPTELFLPWWYLHFSFGTGDTNYGSEKQALMHTHTRTHTHTHTHTCDKCMTLHKNSR